MFSAFGTALVMVLFGTSVLAQKGVGHRTCPQVIARQHVQDNVLTVLHGGELRKYDVLSGKPLPGPRVKVPASGEKDLVLVREGRFYRLLQTMKAGRRWSHIQCFDEASDQWKNLVSTEREITLFEVDAEENLLCVGVFSKKKPDESCLTARWSCKTKTWTNLEPWPYPEKHKRLPGPHQLQPELLWLSCLATRVDDSLIVYFGVTGHLLQISIKTGTIRSLKTPWEPLSRDMVLEQMKLHDGNLFVGHLFASEVCTQLLPADDSVVFVGRYPKPTSGSQGSEGASPQHVVRAYRMDLTTREYFELDSSKGEFPWKALRWDGKQSRPIPLEAEELPKAKVGPGLPSKPTAPKEKN